MFGTRRAMTRYRGSAPRGYSTPFRGGAFAGRYGQVGGTSGAAAPTGPTRNRYSPRYDPSLETAYRPNAPQSSNMAPRPAPLTPTVIPQTARDPGGGGGLRPEPPLTPTVLPQTNLDYGGGGGLRPSPPVMPPRARPAPAPYQQPPIQTQMGQTAPITDQMGLPISSPVAPDPDQQREMLRQRLMALRQRRATPPTYAGSMSGALY